MKNIIIIVLIICWGNISLTFAKQFVEIQENDSVQFYTTSYVEGNNLKLDMMLKSNMEDNIYVFNDDFMFYNLLDTAHDFIDLNRLTSEIILFDDNKKLELLNNRYYKQKMTSFPTYYKGSKESTDNSFTYKLYRKDLKTYFKPNTNYYMKVKLYYFEESSIDKINEILNIDIRASQIQLYNSSIQYSFRLNNSETFLDCAITNSFDLDPSKLEEVIQKYIKVFEKILRVELLFDFDDK